MTSSKRRGDRCIGSESDRTSECDGSIFILLSGGNDHLIGEAGRSDDTRCDARAELAAVARPGDDRRAGPEYAVGSSVGPSATSTQANALGAGRVGAALSRVQEQVSNSASLDVDRFLCAVSRANQAQMTKANAPKQRR